MANGVLTTGEHARYPLVENGVQAKIMSYVHAAAKPVSRAQLTGGLDHSRGKISTEVGRLIEKGLLSEEGFAESEGGRRSSLLSIPYSAGLIAAVDVGATSIDVALTILASEIVSHMSEPADVRFGPQPILERVKEILSELLEEAEARSSDVLSVGVGVPGPVEQASGLLTSPPIMPGWDRFPIRDAFAGEYAAPVL